MPRKKMNAKKKTLPNKKSLVKKTGTTSVGALSPTGVYAKLDPRGGGPITKA